MKIKLIALLMFFSFPAYSLEYVSVEKKPTLLCTDAEFKGQLAGKNIRLISLTVLKDGKTRIARIDYPNIVPAASEPYNRWSVWVSNYLGLKTPTPSQSATFARSVMSVKQFVETNVSCADFSGVNLPYKLHTDTYDLGAYNTQSGIKAFNESYVPAEVPVVFIADSVLNKRYLLPEHETKIQNAYSMVPNFPAISSLPNGPTHGNLMTFAGFSVNSKLLVNYFAITASHDITANYVPVALEYMGGKLTEFMSENPRNRPVVNLSFGSALGFPPEINRGIQKIIDKGVPVVVSSGNDETFIEPGVERNPNTITVGYSNDMEVLSAYGDNALDFTLNLGGGVIPTYSDEAGKIQYQSYALGKSSTAAMITASTISTMMSMCPEATPRNIKAVLVLTAKPLPVSPSLAINKKNSYLKHGVIDFNEAMILLMSTTCAHRLETPKETLSESVIYASTLPIGPVEPSSPAYQFVVPATIERDSKISVFLQTCKDHAEEGFVPYHQVLEPPRYSTRTEGWMCVKRDETGTIINSLRLPLAYFRPNPKLIFKKYVYISN